MKTVAILTTAAACLIGASSAAPFTPPSPFNPWGMSIIGWIYWDEGCTHPGRPIHYSELVDGKMTFRPEEGMSFQMGFGFDMFQDALCHLNPQSFMPMQCGRLSGQHEQCGKSSGNNPSGGPNGFNPPHGTQPAEGPTAPHQGGHRHNHGGKQ